MITLYQAKETRDSRIDETHVFNVDGNCVLMSRNEDILECLILRGWTDHQQNRWADGLLVLTTTYRSYA